MKQITLRPITLILIVLLVAGVTGIALLLPAAMESRRVLDIELSATPTPTADVRSMLLVTPDPNNTPAPTPLLLRPGVKGDEVARLQQRLKELGYYTGDVDGAYGPGTSEAVLLFQSQHGLSADGIAGEKTREQLYAADAQTFLPTLRPASQPLCLKRATPTTVCAKCSSA